ncbi:MAG: 2OG-Fe(II) oxygenase [Pseudomonadota bacterium]
METPSLLDIERRAEAGEAAAQYALAAALAGRQQAEAARLWLERAAAQGHADALFTLAGAVLTTTEAARERRTEAIDGLKAARDKGSVAALRVLAALKAAGLDGEADWPAALSMMREAVERDDASAMRESAAILFEAGDGDAAGALLNEAAKRDALASALIARRSHRGCATPAGPMSIGEALERLSKVEDRRTFEAVSDKPRVRSVRSAFGVDLCSHLIGAALPRLRRQEVIDPGDNKSRAHPHRTAWGAGIGFGFADLPAVFAGQRMARLAGIPYSHGETLTILRYRPGEEYRPHHDFLAHDDPDLPLHGQRVRTALLYLNEDYEGGETHFLTPNLKFTGKTGDVLIFDNVDETGAPDVSARHAGRPVIRGEKWLATLWFRDRPFAG